MSDTESSPLDTFFGALDDMYHAAVAGLQLRHHETKVKNRLDKDQELIALIAQDADPIQVQELLDRKYAELDIADKARVQGMIATFRSIVAWMKKASRQVLDETEESE